jgi:addiction module HigA family antidote
MLKEGIDAYGISQYRRGKDLKIAHSTITGIGKGRQKITAPIALKIGKYLGTSAEYWINLQRRYDLETESGRIVTELAQKVAFPKLKPSPSLYRFSFSAEPTRGGYS